VVENLDRGAVENWLVRMLAHAHNTGVAVDWSFYCAVGVTGTLDEQAKALRARVIHSPVEISNKLAFARALRAEMKRDRYDVLHCHHDLVSGVYLLAAAGLPIKKRLVHVHNADEAVLTPSAVKQAVFKPLLRGVCLALADSIIGISNHTLDRFLNGRQRRPGRDVVHYYGIDAERFRTSGADRLAFRTELGVAADARLLLFAGRVVPEKNPLFAIEVFAELHRRDPRVVCVFCGAGSLEESVRRRVAELGLEAVYRDLGWRRDVPEIMSCSDWFILPRPEDPPEGFGIAVVEAQLAGLRLLLSRGIPDDPLLRTARYRRLRLDDAPAAWAQAALDLYDAPAPTRADALAALAESPMDMERALHAFTRLHA
jgi:glycosyltransferase involved in cell wall biosynthesis